MLSTSARQASQQAKDRRMDIHISRWPALKEEGGYQAEADAVPQNQEVDEDESPLG